MVCDGGVTQPDSASHLGCSATSLEEVRLSYRQLCLLRVSGDYGPVRQRVEHELAEVLTRLPRAGDMATVLREIYAAEEERVANASVLSRLLAPLLEGQLSGFRSFHAAPTVSAPSPRPPVRSHASPSVADFIDEMIAAEQTGQPGRS